MRYIGRFAPSPTGPLHFGSLVAALASWLDARAAGGTWHLRIEDLDQPRERPGATDDILRALEALGLDWDGPVIFQSRRGELYRAALERLAARALTYWCGCSRREVADSSLGAAADSAPIYPGTCRSGLAGKTARALRLRTVSDPIRFTDRAQGPQQQSIEREVGDFVLLRADGIYAYQLAVVVDDAEQGVTDVVRGADLLDSTPRQIYLQQLLGYATPRYLHVPVALNAAGEKLSKQTDAAPIELAGPAAALARALLFLGHVPPGGLDARELLGWARGNWQPERIPARRTLGAIGALAELR
jgi:glutamyl-Q tRNA(Asp) synthetase